MGKTNIIVYKKLVRDNIPAIIMANGGSVKLSRLNDDAGYVSTLIDKLAEEKKELALALYDNYESEEACMSAIKDELADLYTVLDAIRITCGISQEELTDTIINKIEEKGSFKERYFLEEVETYEEGEKDNGSN